MPELGGSVEPEVTDVGAEPALDAALSDAQLRDLAEILYKMILDELRIERERLGR